MNNISRKIFPICLLIENKNCLVIGGGKVATRKVKLLLDADAAVKVIAPEITDDIRSLVDTKQVTYIDRIFNESDLDGTFLVYCATNDKTTNNKIQVLCKDKRILCCNIDSGWVDGDFLTPAIIRQENLTVSVSTGGKACRRSRLVKSSLSRHLSMIDSSVLSVIGTSHFELSAEEREPYHCTDEKYLTIANMIHQIWGIHEFILLNTCNRIELYIIGSISSEVKLLLKKILFDNLSDHQYYYKEGFEAFEHGVALCSGLLSQLPGENHITAQMKDCVTFCINKSWAGPIMQEWFASTLFIAREVRQATVPFLRNEEFEDIAFKFIKNEFLAIKPPVITLIGTGMVGSNMLRKLLDEYSDIYVNWIYHRNIPEVSFQYRNQIELSDFSSLSDKIQMSDIVISAIRTDSFLVSSLHSKFIKQNAILIDLSIPRSIDPLLLQTNTSLKIVDLEALKIWYRIEQVDRTNLISICHNIAQTNRNMYDKLISSITGRNPQQ